MKVQEYIQEDGSNPYQKWFDNLDAWNAVLGRCKFGAKCKYKKNHPSAGELPDTYAAAVVLALQQGVN